MSNQCNHPILSLYIQIHLPPPDQGKIDPFLWKKKQDASGKSDEGLEWEPKKLQITGSLIMPATRAAWGTHDWLINFQRRSYRLSVTRPLPSAPKSPGRDDDDRKSKS